MNEKSHWLTSRFAVDFANRYWACNFPASNAKRLVRFSVDIDHVQDLEIVEVQFGQDDPHKHEVLAINDIPRFSMLGKDYTAFNHFIDIKKGRGGFDDYDGYSYFLGSACKREYESIGPDLPIYLRVFYGHMKVDEFINFGLNNDYAHAYGQKWYHRCSPALSRYSFYQEQGKFSSLQAELLARFPMAEGRGKNGHGIPYSIFMPVDNLGRYWYEQFLKKKQLHLLGAVLHAVQDACVPHHAAGYNGNWHMQYEQDLDQEIEGILSAPGFSKEVKRITTAWVKADSPAPVQQLRLLDRKLAPGLQWSIQQCITWCALQAFWEYGHTYKHFQKGYRKHDLSLRSLQVLAAAMSILVLLKARKESPADRERVKSRSGLIHGFQPAGNKRKSQ